jgi:hypothetical protein
MRLLLFLSVVTLYDVGHAQELSRSLKDGYSEPRSPFECKISNFSIYSSFPSLSTPSQIIYSLNTKIGVYNSWFYGSQPIQQKKIDFRGFNPGSKIKDPYTGTIYTVSETK